MKLNRTVRIQSSICWWDGDWEYRLTKFPWFSGLHDTDWPGGVSVLLLKWPVYVSFNAITSSHYSALIVNEQIWCVTLETLLQFRSNFTLGFQSCAISRSLGLFCAVFIRLNQHYCLCNYYYALLNKLINMKKCRNNSRRRVFIRSPGWWSLELSVNTRIHTFTLSHSFQECV